ncbi:MAG: OmpH family outer membrane protein [Roseivirga sp.]|nr:OmpH family outer membrane protein [Roseivirga sp.]
MKIRLFAIVACLLLLSVVGKAQNLKIGYVKVEKIFAEWPKTKASDKELQDYETQLQVRLQAKVKDFQNKMAKFNKDLATMDALTKKDTETELQNLQTQIQQFEANAQQSVNEKNLALLKPLQNKLKQAIDQVAIENGYTHILDYGSSLVYTSDKTGDISAQVAQKLGFTLSSDSQ